MTGGHGAAPYFSEFMNDFMKDKPRASFPKTPKMPEDMKAIIEQRKREFAEAEKLAREKGEDYGGGGYSGGGSRSGGSSRPRSTGGGGDTIEDPEPPKLDTVTLPPSEPRGTGDRDATPPKPGGDPAPGPKPKADPPPAVPKPTGGDPAGTTRPRETAPKPPPAPPEPKKQGKKGNDDPPQ
jgi:membrane peptidoglycan carboxypeptidase